MQPIYQPSVIPDQRTRYSNTAQIIKELDRRGAGKCVTIKQSKISKDVYNRIHAKRGRGRPRKEG